MWGNRYDIIDAVKKYDINRIIYAIPATTGKNRKDILNICKRYGLPDADRPRGYISWSTGKSA